ncbi:MAG: PfkB family carbohydrate kinase [Chloroflexi bacterium]|nr:PfkB family carbohydrate kinase [Chloroflexota bacterium]
MHPITPLEPVDYLVIGHLTRDLTSAGPRLGGTAAYAALTAHALGLRVGIVTSWGEEVSHPVLRRLPIANYPSESSTTFENVATPEGRIQFVHFVASRLDLNLVPDAWRNPAIVHLGPLVNEVEPSLARNFPDSLVGVTPQGYLRSWDSKGRVHPCEWPEASFVLQRAGAAVLSIEDVGSDEERIAEMAASCRILAVTEAANGARLYWNGDVRRFRPPKMQLVDDVGAGDIFAAAFFSRLYATRDPWEAARFATHVAAFSVTRKGLESIPTAEEIQECMVEVL